VSVGLENTAKTLKSLTEKLEGVQIRKNSVLVVEYLVTASPDWFLEDSSKPDEYFASALKWLKDKHGEDNVLGGIIHNDEKTPHMTVYVVPKVGNKLAASRFFDGSARLRMLQTSFADEVGKPHGLNRGLQGTKARHQTLKKYYAKLQSEDSMDPAVAQAKAKQFDIDQENKVKRERALKELRENSLQLRTLPLPEVMIALGCTVDPKDPGFSFRTPKGRISLDREHQVKFHNHTLEEGGGGAIDLVCHVLECPPKQAMAWLCSEFGERNVAQELAVKAQLEAAAASTERVPNGMEMHQDDPNTWDRVKAYLVHKRKLGAKLVEKLKQAGKVWSDRYENAVFPLMDGSTKGYNGLYLRGTGPKAFHGVRGKKGAFVMMGKDKDTVAIVESPMDSLSFRALGFDGTIVATCGNPKKELFEWIKTMGRKVTIAMDSDPAGQKMAASIAEHIPDATIAVPEGKDWNEDLVKKSAGDGSLEGM
jgi:5S rRNA maturation endonuclease (ribonuclease M5)